jgi:hypothetical protein
MDVTGHRQEFEFEWTYLEKSEWSWLEALHTRLVPGPFRLINPMKTNLLTLRATNGDATNRTAKRDGVHTPATFEKSTDFPPGYYGRSVKLTEWAAGLGYWMFDYDKPVPVMPFEVYTASVWLKADATRTDGFLRVRFYDKDKNLLSEGEEPTGSVTSTWTRFSVDSFSPPTGSAGMVFLPRFTEADNDNPVYMAMPQFEAGGLSEWEVGGGAPEVLLDQLETTTPRFPLRDATLTLLEA